MEIRLKSKFEIGDKVIFDPHPAGDLYFHTHVYNIEWNGKEFVYSLFPNYTAYEYELELDNGR